MADAARRLDRRDLRCAAILALANIDQRQGRAGEARPKLDEARTIAAEVGDRALQIRARFESANLRSWFEGDVEAAADELRQALALARADDDRALQVEASMRLGSLLLNAGDLADAETQLAGAATLASGRELPRRDSRLVAPRVREVLSRPGRGRTARAASSRAVRADVRQLSPGAEPPRAREVCAGTRGRRLGGGAPARGLAARAGVRRVGRDRDLPLPRRGAGRAGATGRGAAARGLRLQEPPGGGPLCARCCTPGAGDRRGGGAGAGRLCLVHGSLSRFSRRTPWSRTSRRRA